MTEIAASDTNQIVLTAKEMGISERAPVLQELQQAFQPMFETAEDLVRESRLIEVRDATEVSVMKRARAMRLKLREVRVQAEKTRKSMKEDSLRMGKAIDGVANVLKALIEPEEKRLEEQEKFAERKEAKRKESLRTSRADLLRPFGVDASYYNLADMPEETFTELFNTAKLAHEKRLDDERLAREKAEDERKAKEEEDRKLRDENRRLEAERQRLELEKIAAELQAKREREAAEAIVLKERTRREALESESNRRQEVEDNRLRSEQRAAKIAEMAPDAEKIRVYLDTLTCLAAPTLKTGMAKTILERFSVGLQSLSETARSATDEMSSTGSKDK